MIFIKEMPSEMDVAPWDEHWINMVLPDIVFLLYWVVLNGTTWYWMVSYDIAWFCMYGLSWSVLILSPYIAGQSRSVPVSPGQSQSFLVSDGLSRN